MAIDWNAIRRRLDAAAEVMERGMTRTPEEVGRILHARALALAREPEGREADGETLELLEFCLAYENYGIEISFIREVYPLRSLIPLPGAPPFVLGIVNVRGQICSVIDLRKFFDLEEKGLSDLNKVIIVHHDGIEFGVLADAIVGICPVRVAAIQPSLPTLTGIREKYLRGVAGGKLIVLDAVKLLSDRSLIVNGREGV